MEFKPYGKTKRYSSGENRITITEKINGTNGCIVIDKDLNITVGSRKRIITPERDNYGFAGWVERNKEEIVKLGPGVYYGEWWGTKIQGNPYNADEKHFSIFNTYIPSDTLPDCIKQVPILYEGAYSDEIVKKVFNDLWNTQSTLGGEPEGIVIDFHMARAKRKMTYKNSRGKWLTDNNKG